MASLLGADKCPSTDSIPEEVVKLPTIKDFTIIKPISRGAFGKVFLCQKNEKPDKIFAVKVMKKTDMVNKNMMKQVLTERDVLACSRSPFVVQLFYSMQTKNNIYLVMEYMIGGDVKSLLHIYGFFDEDMAVFYASEAAHALEYLHQHNIVHRDLKPDNMLISSSGHIKLTDFGLSKITVNKTIKMLDILGTPGSAADERLPNRTPGQLLSLTSVLGFSSRRSYSSVIASTASPSFRSEAPTSLTYLSDTRSASNLRFSQEYFASDGSSMVSPLALKFETPDKLTRPEKKKWLKNDSIYSDSSSSYTPYCPKQKRKILQARSTRNFRKIRSLECTTSPESLWKKEGIGMRNAISLDSCGVKAARKRKYSFSEDICLPPPKKSTGLSSVLSDLRFSANRDTIPSNSSTNTVDDVFASEESSLSRDEDENVISNTKCVSLGAIDKGLLREKNFITDKSKVVTPNDSSLGSMDVDLYLEQLNTPSKNIASASNTSFGSMAMNLSFIESPKKTSACHANDVCPHPIAMNVLLKEIPVTEKNENFVSNINYADLDPTDIDLSFKEMSIPDKSENVTSHKKHLCPTSTDLLHKCVSITERGRASNIINTSFGSMDVDGSFTKLVVPPKKAVNFCLESDGSKRGRGLRSSSILTNTPDMSSYSHSDLQHSIRTESSCILTPVDNKENVSKIITPLNLPRTPYRTPKSVRRGPEPDSNERILGTPDYLAPELLLHEAHGFPVDWWALGVCLFEFLTGIPPFNDSTAEGVFKNILNRDIPWPDGEEALSENAKNAIDMLLTTDVKSRPGARELKTWPLFEETEWENILQMQAPFVPVPDSQTDTTYFDARNEVQHIKVSSFEL